METPKIAVVIINGGTIKTLTVLSLCYALNVTKGNKDLNAIVGGYPAYSRNVTAIKAIDLDYTHIMFIDNDMVFPSHGINRLMELNKDVVGANYNARELPLVCTVKIMDENGKKITGKKEDLPKEPFKCYALGMGFCLIKTSVFKTLQRPYFQSPVYEDGQFMTEDVYFCELARKAGFDIWCDPTLEVNHIGDYQY